MGKTQITACIDGSEISSAVCNTAAWASKTLQAPLSFLHVLEKSHTAAVEDYSGTIGLGSREHLLDDLTTQDEKRNKQAIEAGKQLLEQAQQTAANAGAINISIQQRHDELLDALLTCENNTRLFVIGRLGDDHDIQNPVIGSHIKTIVRSVHTPILMATGKFSTPNNYMLAYDGSETSDKAIEKIANSPLLKNLPGHIVMVGDNNTDNQQRLSHASELLSAKGHQIQTHLLQGHVVDRLMEFQNEHGIELKVMGAYGHSFIRELILGSNTTKILAASRIPVLILR